MEKLTKLLHAYKEYVESGTYHEDNDYRHYIYQAAVEAILGEDFWNTLQSK